MIYLLIGSSFATTNPRSAIQRCVGANDEFWNLDQTQCLATGTLSGHSKKRCENHKYDQETCEAVGVIYNGVPTTPPYVLSQGFDSLRTFVLCP